MLHDLLYIDEHLSCCHYVNDFRCCFRYYDVAKPLEFQGSTKRYNHLLFMLEGEAVVSCDEFAGRSFKSNEVVLLPKSSEATFVPEGQCKVLFCIFDVPKNICDKLNFKSYWQMCRAMEYDFRSVAIRPQMKNFVDSMVYYLRNGINCEHFHEIKQKEMFLVFRWFYKKEELAQLFYPMIGRSLDFKALILENYLKVGSVNDLVKLSGMGRTSFDGQFKNEFGMPARQWMLKQTAKHVLHDLTVRGMSINEAMLKFGFNSASHFTRFCRQQFGCTPTQLISRNQQSPKTPA